jgi:hypothetical protein
VKTAEIRTGKKSGFLIGGVKKAKRVKEHPI